MTVTLIGNIENGTDGILKPTPFGLLGPIDTYVHFSLSQWTLDRLDVIRNHLYVLESIQDGVWMTSS